MERLAPDPISRNSVVRYTVALIVTAVALMIGRALDPLLSDLGPAVAVFPAIVFCTWYCGLGPSILSAILALVGLKYGFIPPVHTFRIVSLTQAFSLLSLLIAFGAILAMGEITRRENQRLRHAQGELEERVQQRTAELDTANQSLRELTARLMQLQDDERRRIARELHDSVGQMLTAISMNLSAVGADFERLAQTAKAVSESAALVQEMHKEVRTISYLLHPPLLDETGIVAALRWYVEGFSERSKIQVDLEISQDFGRLPQEMETTLFRTVQECLTNIHRHSGSSVAKVRLTRSSSEVCLRVEDKGAGMPVEKLDEVLSSATPGVGLRGMRERLHQLGGSLEINSGDGGTVIEAYLPIAFSSSSIAAA